VPSAEFRDHSNCWHTPFPAGVKDAAARPKTVFPARSAGCQVQPAALQLSAVFVMVTAFVPSMLTVVAVMVMVVITLMRLGNDAACR
jgi:hypothetical protein